LPTDIAILVSPAEISVPQAELGRARRVRIWVRRCRTRQLHAQCRKNLGIAWRRAEFRAGYRLHGVDQHRQPSPFAIAGSPTADLLTHHSLPDLFLSANPADANSGACNPVPDDRSDKEIRQM
jgi:hypothetical protein